MKMDCNLQRVCVPGGSRYFIMGFFCVSKKVIEKMVTARTHFSYLSEGVIKNNTLFVLFYPGISSSLNETVMYKIYLYIDSYIDRALHSH